MKLIQKARRHRGSAVGRQEPPAVDPRDQDIILAHRIACPGSRSGAGRAGFGSHSPTAPIHGR
jgi:hypothetical protein